jgi:hypothetical protein
LLEEEEREAAAKAARKSSKRKKKKKGKQQGAMPPPEQAAASPLEEPSETTDDTQVTFVSISMACKSCSVLRSWSGEFYPVDTQRPHIVPFLRSHCGLIQCEGWRLTVAPLMCSPLRP